MTKETNMASALQKPSGLKEYKAFLHEIKNKIVESRINAAKSVNQAFIGMYWFIGQMIVEKQQQLRWGKSVVEMLSNDLKNSFPEMTGFSPQNLWLTRQFYLEYSTFPILQQLVGEIPWGHNVLIMQKVKGEAQRRYYLESTAKLGWTRDVLLNQIKAKAFEFSLLEKLHEQLTQRTPNELTSPEFVLVRTSSLFYSCSFMNRGFMADFAQESLILKLVSSLLTNYPGSILLPSPKTCKKIFVHPW